MSREESNEEMGGDGIGLSYFHCQEALTDQETKRTNIKIHHVQLVSFE